MLLNHKGNTLIESLFALSIYLMIVVYSNKQELRIVEEGDDLQSKLKEALRS